MSNQMAKVLIPIPFQKILEVACHPSGNCPNLDRFTELTTELTTELSREESNTIIIATSADI